MYEGTVSTTDSIFECVGRTTTTGTGPVVLCRVNLGANERAAVFTAVALSGTSTEQLTGIGVFAPDPVSEWQIVTDNTGALTLTGNGWVELSITGPADVTWTAHLRIEFTQNYAV